MNVDLGPDYQVWIVSAGFYHSCAVMLEAYDVRCWGYNDYGQLGIGSTENVGDEQGEMGIYLETSNLGTNVNAQNGVSNGDFHNCIISQDFQVKCWGYTNNGRLGYPGENNWGDDANEMGDYLPFVNIGTGVTVTIIHSDDHNCAIMSDAGVKCWGVNVDGQLGYGDTQNRGDGANEMGDYLKHLELGGDDHALNLCTGDHHSVCISI